MLAERLGKALMTEASNEADRELPDVLARLRLLRPDEEAIHLM
ncbi:MAG: hypothetical protein AB2784_10815 [Candidatus Thiodiazotropha endolucinida]